MEDTPEKETEEDDEETPGSWEGLRVEHLVRVSETPTLCIPKTQAEVKLSVKFKI